MKITKIVLITLFFFTTLNGMERSPRWDDERWTEERNEVAKIMKTVRKLDKKRRNEQRDRERTQQGDTQKPKDVE